MSKPTLAELLAAEKRAMVRPEASTSGSLAGLRAALAEGREPVVDVPPPATMATSSGSIVKAGIVAGAIAIGIAVLVGIAADGEHDAERAAALEGREDGSEPPREPDTHRSSTRDPDPSAEPESARESEPESAPESESESVPESDAAPARPRAPRTSTARPRPTPIPDDPDAGDSAFAEELRLLREAKRSADAGRSRAALRLLDTQARKFPTGFFVEERRALVVRVLCDLGRTADARAAKERFLRDFPASPQTERVRSACD